MVRELHQVNRGYRVDQRARLNLNGHRLLPAKAFTAQPWSLLGMRALRRCAHKAAARDVSEMHHTHYHLTLRISMLICVMKESGRWRAPMAIDN